MRTMSEILKLPFLLVFLVVMVGMGLTQTIARAQSSHGKEEDRKRITYFWRTALSPENYMRALKMTGQKQALQKVRVQGETIWMPIGPTGDFNSSSQNDNGRIRSIHIQSIPGDYYVYVGASSGGLWRARGSVGPVWTNLGNALPNPAVGAFAVHPTQPKEILVGSGDYKRYGGAGMFLTTHAGLSWTQIVLPVSPGSFFRIYYLPGNANIVLAATTRGLLRSTNGAMGPWTVRVSGKISDLVLHPTNPNIQFCVRATSVGSGGGVYKSIDAGKTWTLITTTGAPANAFGVARMAICSTSPNTMAFVYEWGGKIAGIRKSTNGGTTWVDITGSLLNTNKQAFHALAMAIRPKVPEEIYVGSVGLYRSTDGGKTWENVDHENIHRHDDQTQIYFSPVTGSNIMWFCNDGGVYRWTVGSKTSDSWNGNGNTGLRVSQVWQMDAQRDFRVAGLQDVGVVGSTDSGTNWKPFICCDGIEAEITDDLGFVFWFTQGIASSPPPWRVYRQPFNSFRQEASSSESYLRLFFDRFSNRIYSVNGDGPKWHVVSTASSGSLSWREEILLSVRARRLEGNYLDGNTLYLWNNWSTDTLNVLQRTGNTWSQFIQNFNSNAKITALYASRERPAESWLGFTGSPGTLRVLHTTDFWRTWSDISGTLTNVGAIHAMVVVPFNAKEIYVGTDVGVFRTQDSGLNWEPYQEGLPIVRCTDLRYIVDRTRVGNDRLVVATYGHGLYERTIQRPPLVYVDPRNTDFEDGTFEHPFNTFDEGFNATPYRGVLALNGHIYSVPATLNKPMTINAYESTARLQR